MKTTIVIHLETILVVFSHDELMATQMHFVSRHWLTADDVW